MANHPHSVPTKGSQQVIGDGFSVFIGSLAGAAGGILLGGLIAWTVSPGWSLTSGIIIFHVTLSMIAMGAWTAPSLASDPEKEAAPPHSPATADNINIH